MIQSLYQVDFITPSGTARLVSVGDLIEGDIVPKVSQGATRYAPIGADWEEREADGGATTALNFSVVNDHASHAALRNHCLRSAASFQSSQSGNLRVAISGGDTWEIQDAVLLSLEPQPKVPCKTFQTITAYSAVGGRLLPISILTVYPGIPWDFLNQDWDNLTTLWDNF